MSCSHPDIWFDRTLCPPPCATMHERCVQCGEALDVCFWEVPAHEQPQ